MLQSCCCLLPSQLSGHTLWLVSGSPAIRRRLHEAHSLHDLAAANLTPTLNCFILHTRALILNNLTGTSEIMLPGAADYLDSFQPEEQA